MTLALDLCLTSPDAVGGAGLIAVSPLAALGRPWGHPRLVSAAGTCRYAATLRARSLLMQPT